MIVKTKPCIGCLKVSEVEVSDSGFHEWHGGAHVQDAFPELSSDDREMLISGTCPKCWDEIFADEDDDS